MLLVFQCLDFFLSKFLHKVRRQILKVQPQCLEDECQLAVHTAIYNLQESQNLLHSNFSCQISNLTEERIAKSNGHGLGLRVIGQCSLTQFPSDTRFLEATERKLVVEKVVAVAVNIISASDSSSS